MAKIGKAHIEAMKALQEAKKSMSVSDDVVKDLKQEHQDFLDRQKRGKEVEKDVAKKDIPKKDAKEATPFKSEKESSIKISQSVKRLIVVIASYVFFLLFLLLLGILFPENKSLRYYANGFYAWFGYQPFKDVLAFDSYPLNCIVSGDKKFHDTMEGDSKTIEFDTISIQRDFHNAGSVFHLDYHINYPVKLCDYDLRKLHHIMYENIFHTGRGLNLDFKEAIQQDVNNIIDSEVVEHDNLYVDSYYDESLKWLHFHIERNHGGIYSPSNYITEDYIYDMEKQCLLDYDDLFKTEKNKALHRFIRYELLKQYTDMSEMYGNTNWDFRIIQFSRYADDGVWYYEFNCHTNLDLPLVHSILPVKIPENELTEYLRYNP